ncbi:MAG: dipeptidase [Thermoplasmata archaeon]
MRFIDLHEDIGITSQRADIIHDSEQSNLDALRKFDDVLIFGVSFPHISTMNERSSSNERRHRNKSSQTSRATVASWEDLMEQLKVFKYLERAGEINIVHKKNDLKKRGIKILLSLEGTDCLKEPYDLYLLRDLGLRNLGLTWNYDTKFAAAAMSKKDYGLTGFGEDLIKIANELRVIVDLAHASKKTILDTCIISKMPVIDSHTNLKSVHDHVRNIDDESIEAITKTDGVIGITAIKGTLGDNPSIEDMVTNMEYVGDNFGWRYVALGTDFLGITETPRGFEDVSKVGSLAEMLGTRAKQVLWDNAMRVIEKSLSR